MTISIAKCIVTATLAAAPVAWATPVADDFDFAKINASLRTALTDFSAQSELVDLMYQFDAEATDIAADRFSLDMELDLAETAWSSDGLSATGKLGFRADTGDAGGLTVAVDAIYTTDALGMLKFKVKKISNCAAADKGAGIMGVLWQRHCEYVARLDGVASTAALHDLLVEKLAAHRQDVADYKRSLSDALATLGGQVGTSSSIIGLLQAQAKAADGAQAFLDGVVLTRTTDGFTIEAPAFDGCPVLGSSGLQLSVAPTRLVVQGEFRLKFGQTLYAAAKPVLAEILHGLERGDATAMQFVRLDAEVFANLIAAGLTP